MLKQAIVSELLQYKLLDIYDAIQIHKDVIADRTSNEVMWSAIPESNKAIPKNFVGRHYSVQKPVSSCIME